MAGISGEERTRQERFVFDVQCLVGAFSQKIFKFVGKSIKSCIFLVFSEGMHSGYPLVAKLSDLERMTLPPPPSLNESVSSMARGGEIRSVRE